MRTRGYAPFSNNLSPPVTLKMGLRSPKSNQFFYMSQQYRCASLVKIYSFLQEKQAIFQQSKPSWTLKIDSFWSELTNRGSFVWNGILKPCRPIERTHLLSVNSSHCSTKWANLPPTGISWRGSTGSGKGWLSKLCGGRGKFRGGELSSVTIPPSEILFITSCTGLSMCFRSIR